jgi:Ni/Fe-hydrogenase subunit HybB-like protein
MSGTQSWLTATLIALCLVLIIVSIAVYFVYRHRSFKVFQEMESPQSTWRFTDDAVSVESDIGRSEFKWQIIKKLWRFDDVWLLVYTNQTYSTLPIADVPEVAKQFIVDRVRSHGGKVS